MQPGTEYTEEAYEGARLVAAYMRDVHLLRTSLVKFNQGDPVDDG